MSVLSCGGLIRRCCSAIGSRRSISNSSVLRSTSGDGESGQESLLISGGDGLEGTQQAIWDTARDFARREMEEQAASWDRDEHLPIDVLRGLGALGFAGLYVPESAGGSGLSRLDAAIAFEALSMACVSTTAYLSIHNMCAWMLGTYGSEALRSNYLPGLLDMTQMASYCLTEPGSGSDAASLSTTAVPDPNDGDWRLNGSKAFISGGGSSDVYLVMCRTGGPKSNGISCLLVPKDAPGLTFGAKERKLGWNSQPTRALFFDDCRVPRANVVGELGQGFKIAMAGLDGGRINIGACSVGGGAACLQHAKTYVGQRKQFGSALSSYQNVQFELADLAIGLVASRRMIRSAAEKLDANHPEKTGHCAMAKKFATDTCFDIANRSLQLFGGYGYLNDYPIERYLRDVRVHQILEGTNQVMSMIISRRLLE